MKDFAKSIVCNTKAGNSKVGNGSGSWHGNIYEDRVGWSATVTKKGNKWEVWLEDPRTNGKLVGLYDDERTAKRQAEASVECEKIVKNSKTGNADLSAISKHWSKATIDHILQNAHVFKKEVVEEAKRLKEAEKNKTGNDTPAEYFSKKPKVIGNEKTGAEGFFKQLSDDVKEREKKDDEEIKLVGNETYQHKLYPDKYIIVEGNKYTIITDGKVEKSGYLTDAVLLGINQVYKKVGNVASEYEILKQDPSKMHPLYKKAYEEAMKKLAREDEEFKKRFEKEYGVKAKNEASDDKFAYVMREFDEGKLKTPDGKVVTDPQQAKAIAYSESKKTENGLARARNAMNKKTGNGLYDIIKQKTSHIKRYGAGSKVRTDEGEIGTVVKETVEVGPNGIPFGWVSVKLPNGKVVEYYDYDLKKA